MSLVVIAAGAIGLSTTHVVSNRRFESSVDTLLARLALAQEVMVCCDADLTIHITPTGVQITSEQLLPDGFSHALRPLKLVNVTAISHETIDFPAHRRHEITRGTLTLTSSRNRTATIALPGYPTRLARA